MTHLKWLLFLLSLAPSLAFPSDKIKCQSGCILAGGTRLTAKAHVRGFPWKDEMPSARGANNIIAVIEGINSQYHSVLSMPEKIDLHIRAVAGPEIGFGPISVFPGAHFDPKDDHLMIGVAFGWSKEFPQTPELSLPVAAHEYGHAIFDHNLTLVDPLLAQIKTLYREMRQYELKHEKLMADYAKPLNQHYLEERFCGAMEYDWRLKTGFSTEPKRSIFIEFCNELKALAPEQNRLKALSSKYEYTVEEITRYHELFADIVGVLENRDFDAIAKVFMVEGDEDSAENKERSALRSFSQCPSVESFENRQVHSYFSPTRCEIGRIITASQLTNPQLLKRFFDVLSQDLVESIKSDGPVTDSVTDNKRLIKKLNANFKI